MGPVTATDHRAETAAEANQLVLKFCFIFYPLDLLLLLTPSPLFFLIQLNEMSHEPP